MYSPRTYPRSVPKHSTRRGKELKKCKKNGTVQSDELHTERISTETWNKQYRLWQDGRDCLPHLENAKRCILKNRQFQRKPKMKSEKYSINQPHTYTGWCKIPAYWYYQLIAIYDVIRNQRFRTKRKLRKYTMSRDSI